MVMFDLVGEEPVLQEIFVSVCQMQFVGFQSNHSFDSFVAIRSGVK